MDNIVNSVMTYAFIFLIFASFFAVIVIRIRNNNSPIMSVDAKIVDKRMETHHDDGDSYTTYRATFEMQGGERKEFRIPRSKYGLLVEGDEGVLSFQGTRYLGFERK